MVTLIKQGQDRRSVSRERSLAHPWRHPWRPSGRLPVAHPILPALLPHARVVVGRAVGAQRLAELRNHRGRPRTDFRSRLAQAVLTGWYLLQESRQCICEGPESEVCRRLTHRNLYRIPLQRDRAERGGRWSTIAVTRWPRQMRDLPACKPRVRNRWFVAVSGIRSSSGVATITRCVLWITQSVLQIMESDLHIRPSVAKIRPAVPWITRRVHGITRRVAEIAQPVLQITGSDPKIRRRDLQIMRIYPKVIRPVPRIIHFVAKIGSHDPRNARIDPKNNRSDPEKALPDPKNAWLDPIAINETFRKFRSVPTLVRIVLNIPSSDPKTRTRFPCRSV